MNRWRARDPVMRFQSLLLASDWWDAEKEKDLRLSLRQEVRTSSETLYAVSIPLSKPWLVIIHQIDAKIETAS